MYGVGGYYMVESGASCRVEGPCARWQDACIRAFGIIDTEFRVKGLGVNAYWATKASHVSKERSDPRGWFRPYVPSSELGVTFLAEEALGPPEIAAAMSGHADRIAASADRAAAEAEWAAAGHYLQWIPVTAAAKFSDLYNNICARHDRRAEVEARGRESREGPDAPKENT